MTMAAVTVSTCLRVNVCKIRDDVADRAGRESVSRSGWSQTDEVETTGERQQREHGAKRRRELYLRYADVMYTIAQNLEHTIQVQQALFRQQLHPGYVSDSTTSISCGFVLQQVVRLVVRLADCCMQLAVDLFRTYCATSCPTCCTTCCLFYNLLWTSVVDLLLAFEAMEHRVCHMTSTCCGSVVQHVVTTSCMTSPQQNEVMESETIRRRTIL